MYVLFVDDNPDARVNLTLEHDGAIVDVAAGAAEAIRKLGIVKPDVIITALTMPGMEGYALFAELKASAPLRAIPVIAITGVSGRGAEYAGLAAGFAAY